MRFFAKLFVFLLGNSVVVSAIAADRYDLTFRMGLAVDPISSSVLVPPPTTDLDPELFNTTDRDSYFFDSGLEFTYLMSLHQAWSLRTGIEYFFSGPQEIQGDYYARPIAPADQAYTFNLNVQRLLLISELWYQINPTWSVFGGVNAGAARIQSSAVVFTSILQSGGASLPLTSSKSQTTNFVYGVTLGANYAFNTQWSLKGGMDYSWLQEVNVPYNNGVSNININIGRLAPYEFWLGVAYQF